MEDKSYQRWYRQCRSIATHCTHKVFDSSSILYVPCVVSVDIEIYSGKAAGGARTKIILVLYRSG